MSDNRFYVYAHHTTNGKLFYIGKGAANRLTSKAGRNQYWQRVANKYGYYATKICENLTHELALELEEFLIAEVGRENLTNLSDGGIGAKGYKMTEDQRKKVSERSKGKIVSEETRRKLSKINTGERSPMYGRKHSEETIKKMSEKAKTRKYTDEAKEKMIVSLRKYFDNNGGRKHSEETIEKIRAKAKARGISDKTRAAATLANTGRVSVRRKKVICVDLGICFLSMMSAADYMNSIGFNKISFKSISAAVNKKNGITHGFKFVTV